jgi:peroxiredoxin (alkyl hydroperoxide reductase subunit C)
MDEYLVPLRAGTEAPNFTLRRTSWQMLSLHRLAGQPIILAFFPTAFEPVSREQLLLYQEYLPQFEALHGQLLGISADHAWCHEAFCREAGLTFPLLADTPPSGRVSQLYGVYRPPEGATGRALFVIDSSGIIRFAEVYPDLLNPGVDDVLTVLESLQAHNACSPVGCENPRKRPAGLEAHKTIE